MTKFKKDNLKPVGKSSKEALMHLNKTQRHSLLQDDGNRGYVGRVIGNNKHAPQNIIFVIVIAFIVFTTCFVLRHCFYPTEASWISVEKCLYCLGLAVSYMVGKGSKL